MRRKESTRQTLLMRWKSGASIKRDPTSEKLRGLTGHHVIGSNNKLLLVVVMEWEGGWCTEYLQQHLTCSTSPFTFHLPSIHLPNLLIFILLLFIPYPRSWL